MRHLLVVILLVMVSHVTGQCDLISAGGPQQQVIMTLPSDLPNLPYLWQTTASDGTVLNSDSDSNNIHFVANSNLYDTIITCLSSSSGVCCMIYHYTQGTTWSLIEPEPCDTIYINTTEYLTDTVYINTVEYSTDTLVQYVSSNTYIDCDTGQPCDQQSSYDIPSLCDEASIYAPISVNPGGTWYVTADDECWHKWSLDIYDVIGNLVWHGYSMYDEWYVDVPLGTYLYVISTESYITNSMFSFNGTITVLY
jgi:hypothetical protein